jgi:hypothetical protein
MEVNTMESLQVRTGQISLQILDDDGNPRGVFKFNPEDIESAKQVIALQAEVREKEAEYLAKTETAVTAEDRVELLDEIVTYFNSAIDRCFGAGSSAVLFGGAKTTSMYDDFFQGIIPYYENAGKKRTAKYRKSGK